MRKCFTAILFFLGSYAAFSQTPSGPAEPDTSVLGEYHLRIPPHTKFRLPRFPVKPTDSLVLVGDVHYQKPGRTILSWLQKSLFLGGAVRLARKSPPTEGRPVVPGDLAQVGLGTALPIREIGGLFNKKRSTAYITMQAFDADGKLLSNEGQRLTRKSKNRREPFAVNQGIDQAGYVDISIVNESNREIRLNSYLQTIRQTTNPDTLIQTTERTLSDSTSRIPPDSTVMDRDPCSGFEVLNVGGLTVKQAVDISIAILESGDACSVQWTGSGDGAVVSTTRSHGDMYQFNIRTPEGTTINWNIGSGSGIFSTVGTGIDFFNTTTNELALYSTLTPSQQATYYANKLRATAVWREWTDRECPGGIRNHDGNGNAFLHAFWNAINTRSLGADLTRSLTTAHEMYDGNPVSQFNMDLSNNDLGIRIANRLPGAAEADLANAIWRQICTGHGLEVVGGQVQKSQCDFCN